MITSVRVFEQAVQQLEGFTIVLYASSDTVVEYYDYQRKAPNDQSLADFITTRIRPRIGAIECAVISASNMGRCHPQTRLDFLRTAERLAIEAQPNTTKKQQFGETKRMSSHPDSFPPGFQER